MVTIKNYRGGSPLEDTMEPKDLTPVLKGATPGEWLALSMDRTRVLGRGATAQLAKQSAVQAGHKEVVLFNVPLPSIGIAAVSNV